jgi:hypothetical protein
LLFRRDLAGEPVGEYLAKQVATFGREQFFKVMQGVYTNPGNAPEIQRGSKPTIGSGSSSGFTSPSSELFGKSTSGRGGRGGRSR